MDDTRTRDARAGRPRPELPESLAWLYDPPADEQPPVGELVERRKLLREDDRVVLDDERALRDVRVAVVSMPDAPGRVVTDLTAAVATAGGNVVRENGSHVGGSTESL